jgi:N-acetyl-anhydromuramyl-L-alanine amidase AmpD
VNRPKFVILHGTAGGISAEAIARFFQNAGVSAHYVIGQDGQIVQCNNELDGAWADGIIDGIPMAGLPFRTQSDGVHRDDWWNPNGINPNDMGIAIEHCKPHNDNSDALTPAQQASSLWLVNDICNRWNIPKRFADANGGITGHFSIDAVSRQRCPGQYPWQELFNYLNGGQKPMPPMQPGVNQIKSAHDSWDSVLKNTVAGPAPTGSGIYNEWLAALIQGKFYGPPLTHEYASVDWAGNPIVVQEFGRVRCEWKDGAPNWYGANGKI